MSPAPADPGGTPKKRDEDSSELNVDLYGLKISSNGNRPQVQPGEISPPPENAGELWERVKAGLLSLGDSVVALVPESLRGIRRIIAGVSKSPDAVNERIRGTHRAADQAEATRQAEVEEGRRLPLQQMDARDALDYALGLIRAEGIEYEAQRLPDGRVVFSFCKPGLGETAAALGVDALLEFDPEVGSAKAIGVDQHLALEDKASQDHEGQESDEDATS